MKKISILFLCWHALSAFSVPDMQQRDYVTASVSSVAWRSDSLARVVAALLPQVNRLNVFLQGYTFIPSYLDHPKVTIAQGECYPEVLALGACAKFFWSQDVAGYHILVDDDIVYPPDYVARCIQKIEHYKRRVIVGFHGSVFRFNGKKYSHRTHYPFDKDVAADKYVHMLGTGVLAYHTDTVKVRISDFSTKNMADIGFAILAQKQRIPLLCVQHDAGYISSIEEAAIHPLAISLRPKRGDELVKAIQSFGLWQLYTIEG